MIALKNVTLIGRFEVHVFDKDFLPLFFTYKNKKLTRRIL